jgi:peroxidase
MIDYLFLGIIAKQFRDLKYGDRYYYENGMDDSNKFTLEQLDQIRKSSMARLMCDDIDIAYIQKNPFLKQDKELNPYISCNKIEKMSLLPWKTLAFNDLNY